MRYPRVLLFSVVQLQQEMASPTSLEEKIKREAKQQCQKLQTLAMAGPQVKGLYCSRMCLVVCTHYPIPTLTPVKIGVMAYLHSRIWIAIPVPIRTAKQIDAL